MMKDKFKVPRWIEIIQEMLREEIPKKRKDSTKN